MDTAQILAALGGAGVVFGILRGRNQERRETDAELNDRIDERIEIAVGAKLARITTILEEVQRQLPAAGSIARDNQRIEQLEERVQELSRSIAECFDLARKLERRCLRHQPTDGSDSGFAPRQGARA
jgi:hypothetical protein